MCGRSNLARLYSIQARVPFGGYSRRKCQEVINARDDYAIAAYRAGVFEALERRAPPVPVIF